MVSDFLELKNFTSFILNDGFNFYIDFFSYSYRFRTFFAIYIDLDGFEVSVYLNPLFLFNLKVSFLRSSIIFFAKFILDFELIYFPWSNCETLVFDTLDYEFTLLWKMDLTDLASISACYFYLVFMSFLWDMNPDFTWYFLFYTYGEFFLDTGSVARPLISALEFFRKDFFPNI